MGEFKEGQEVEVWDRAQSPEWHRAKIAFRDSSGYVVQFPDGSRALFDAAHIKCRHLHTVTERWAGYCEDCGARMD